MIFKGLGDVIAWKLESVFRKNFENVNKNNLLYSLNSNSAYKPPEQKVKRSM